jgi:hypothetical protein
MLEDYACAASIRINVTHRAAPAPLLRQQRAEVRSAARCGQGQGIPDRTAETEREGARERRVLMDRGLPGSEASQAVAQPNVKRGEVRRSHRYRDGGRKQEFEIHRLL